MSRKTISRLPTHIQDLLSIYSNTGLKSSLYPDETVNNYLLHSSKQYKQFQQYKLKNEYLHEISHPLETRSTSSLFKKHIKFDAIPSLHKISHHTTYYANLLVTLSSHISPYSSPPPKLAPSFQWYRNTLKTPFLLILKYKNRLFSHDSVTQNDYFVKKMKLSVNQLGNTVGNSVMVGNDRRDSSIELKVGQSGDNLNGNQSGDKSNDGESGGKLADGLDTSRDNTFNPNSLFSGLKDEVPSNTFNESSKNPWSSRPTRTYHFSDLFTYDLFNLAIKSEQVKKDDLQDIKWSEIDKVSDPLVNSMNSEKYKFINSRGEEVEENEVKEYIEAEGVEKLKTTEFPYDLEYNNFHILTIEEPVIKENHQELFNLVENSEFEVVGARLSLENDFINDFITNFFNKSEDRGNYDSLIKEGKSTNMELTMKRLGELGLIRVENGCNKNCLYLLPQED